MGSLFESLEATTSTDLSGIHLHFNGKAWDLLSFVQASSPASGIPAYQKAQLFYPVRTLTGWERYKGLILDHIGWTVMKAKQARPWRDHTPQTAQLPPRWLC